MAQRIATYEDWLEARTHPWECPCETCVIALDDISPELVSSFKDQFKREMSAA